MTESPAFEDRDPMALVMFAAWVNCPVDKLPATYRAHTCKATAIAWERVAMAARKFISEEQEKGLDMNSWNW